MTWNTMDDVLPSEYDVIVVGTGMVESILAAAASRIGKRVLHIDSTEYYGGSWASFNLEGINKWVADCQSTRQFCSENEIKSLVEIKSDESIVVLGNELTSPSNFVKSWGVPQVVAKWNRKSQTSCKDEEQDDGDTVDDQTDESQNRSESPRRQRCTSESEENKDVWSQNKIYGDYRHYNIDLAPKLLFARGSLVELLISSNIARYAEFRAVTRVLTWLDGQLSSVPCSRADVFATRNVNVVEKRMLMKLLTSFMETDSVAKECKDFQGKTFLEYLQSKHLTPHLLHYVLYAIAMGRDDMLCSEGIERTQRFLNSLGRYGNTPFLWPMYGTGELPQAFCRLCAVFGGVYCLQRPTQALVLEKNRCVSVVSGRQRLCAEHFVLGMKDAPNKFISNNASKGISRGVFIVDKTLLESEKEPLTLLQFPPGQELSVPVTVIEVGPGSSVCPKKLFVLHMTCQQNRTAKEDLKEVVECLLREDIVTESQSTQTTESEGPQGDIASPPLNGNRPKALWSLYFNFPDTSTFTTTNEVPSNVYLCSGPDLELDFEFAVNQAKEIFKQMFPNEEFLPRAPDSDEIVLDGGEESTQSEESVSNESPDDSAVACNENEGSGRPELDAAEST